MTAPTPSERPIGTSFEVPSYSSEDVQAFADKEMAEPCHHGVKLADCAMASCVLYRGLGLLGGVTMRLQHFCCPEAYLDRQSVATPPCHGYCDNCEEVWREPDARCPRCGTREVTT